MNYSERARKTFQHPLYFLAMGFGSGLSKWMPGTDGQVIAVPLFMLFQRLWLYWALGLVLAK